MRLRIIASALCGGLLCSAAVMFAQPPRGPGGFGGPGGPGGEERKLLKQFDLDESGWLDSQERTTARAFLKESPIQQRGPGDRGPSGRGPGDRGPGDRGPGDRGPGDRGLGDRGPSDRGPGRDGGLGFGPPGFGPPGFGPPGFGPPGFGPPGFGPPGFGGFRGGPPGRGGDRPEATPGEQIAKSSVQPLAVDLYDSSALRTVFIDFQNSDWEQELEDFHGTDVDVAATLTVDGKEYANCGVHFRGMSSYGMVPAGYKRSLNVSLDLADQEQRLLGYKTLNLLNGSGDESMLSTVLYAHVARCLGVPAPQANFVRVVINGENWGLYTNVQQFNKEFLTEHYGSGQGARWKVSGSPMGGGGLEYRGQDPANYQHPYEQKSGGKKAVEKLIELCRVLEETPASELPAALEPIADVDGLLWFLALDNGLINSDGYWIRASDYSIYLDDADKFHFIPHDMNEAFRGAGGPGMGGPPGGGGRGPGGRPEGRFDGPPVRPGDALAEGSGGPPENGQRAQPGGRDPGTSRGGRLAEQSPLELDPLIGLDDTSKPLRSKVLAVPEYRQRYLANVRTIAEKALDWNELGRFVSQQAALIDATIKTETRKLGSYEAFLAATASEHKPTTENRAESRGGGHGSMNLRDFVQGRRTYLLKATSAEIGK